MRTIVIFALAFCLLGSSLQRSNFLTSQSRSLGAFDTCKSAVTAKQIVDAINLARQNPKQFAEKVKLSKTFYVNGAWRDQFAKDPKCFENGYKFLLTQPALAAYGFSTVLTLAAYQHSVYQSVNKKMGHVQVGAGSSPTMSDRVQKWSTGKFFARAETVSGGMGSGIDYVFNWIADCTVPDRGHRNDVYSPNSKFVGCAEALCTGGNKYATCDFGKLDPTPDTAATGYAEIKKAAGI